ncbi:MAG: PAC2 family protein [Dehalococcoidia bacterium]|nr:PAC2 family protein [Dehalococcoidia bacterium]MSQ17144.1 PAC2 family protein [Dehalococcoidia bacterium]
MDTPDLVTLRHQPAAKYLIAGWKHSWSDGGEVSGGLPGYLMEHLRAKPIGEMGPEVSRMCYPFQVGGTHDAYRPAVAYHDGLPTRPMSRDNRFYDAGQGLVIFLGEEPWHRMDIYGDAFFQAVKMLGVKQAVAVEGYYGITPPELERSINCIYSRPEMKATLERLGVRFSNFGSERRQGPTIGMALVTLAHYQHPEVEMFRLGAMAPMYPFTANQEQVGITTDHRSFYDILRRLRALFQLDLDLSDLRRRADADADRLQRILGRISESNPEAREVVRRAQADYNVISYVEPVALDPSLDRTLEDILRNSPEAPPGT